MTAGNSIPFQRRAVGDVRCAGGGYLPSHGALPRPDSSSISDANVTVAPAASSDYHTWRTRSVRIGDRALSIATKPGLIGHGRDDTAGILLARTVVVPPRATVLQLQCGNGLFGAVASVRSDVDRLLMTDRSVVAVEAAHRTLAIHGIERATVLLGHGSAPLDSTVQADVVAIRIPTEKLALLQLLADAFAMLRIGGQCAIAGATNEGIKSAAALLKDIFGNMTVLGTDSGHRAVMAIKRRGEPTNPAVIASAYLQHDVFHPIYATLRGVDVQLFSRPGAFSWEHLDEGTAILADVMPVQPGDDVLDLGCGVGALGLVSAQLVGTGRVTMVDVDSEAVRCATRAVEAAGLTNCRVLASDVCAAVRDERFDVVISNPPFHIGKHTDLDVPSQFMLDAARVLKSGGRLALVANRTLPYERLVQQAFGNLTTLHDGPRFKVLSAVK